MNTKRNNYELIEFIDGIINELQNNNKKLEALHKEYLSNKGGFYLKEKPKVTIDASFDNKLHKRIKKYESNGIDKLAILKKKYLNDQQSDSLKTDNRSKSNINEKDLGNILQILQNHNVEFKNINKTVNSIKLSLDTKDDDEEEKLGVQINKLNKDLENEKEINDRFEKQIDEYDGNIKKLNSDINNLSKEKDELEKELKKIKGSQEEEHGRSINMFKYIMEKEEYAPIIKKLTRSANSDANQFLFTMESYQTFKSTCSDIKNIHGAHEETAILQLLSQSLLTLKKDKVIDSEQLNKLIDMINSYSTFLKMLTPTTFDSFSSEYHDSISGNIKDGSDLVTDDYKTLILKGRAQTDDTLIIKAFIR